MLQMLRSEEVRPFSLVQELQGGSQPPNPSQPPRGISWASFLLREVEVFVLAALTGRLLWASLRTSQGIFFQGLFLLTCICSHAKIFALLEEGTYFFFPQCLFS